MYELTKESQKEIKQLKLNGSYSKNVIKIGYVVGEPKGDKHIYSSLDLLFEKNPNTEGKIFAAYFHKDEFKIMDLIDEITFDINRYSISSFTEVKTENK
jgi:hypothetical protein